MIGYRSLTTALAVSLLAGFAASQDVPVKVAEPEYSMQFFALDAAGNLLPLERKHGNVEGKVRGLGYGGVNMLTVFTGESSPVRFKADQLQFVFRFDAGSVDPSTMFTLETLTRGKGKRQFKTAQSRLIGKTGTTSGETSIALNYAKYGEHSFRCTPADPLPKGEYALMRLGALDAFLFGID